MKDWLSSFIGLTIEMQAKFNDTYMIINQIMISKSFGEQNKDIYPKCVKQYRIRLNY